MAALVVPMLLIAGGESDPNTQRIVDQAHMRDVDYFFWNTDEANCNQIAWDFAQPALDLGDRRIQPTSAYLRWNVFGGDVTQNRFAHETLQSYVLAWPHIQVMNRCSCMDVNNKSFNLRLAEQVGFEIPETLVMNHLGPLQSMPDADQRIAKPLNGGAHTQNVAELAQTEGLLELPPQFIQNQLLGENLRIFGIGGKLFCFHLETTKLDYRDDNEVQVHHLDVPESLVAPTRKLIEEKQFDYCALDFRCREGMDAPVFLEVNSFPMFVRFDDAAENALADAVIDLLVIS